MANKSDKIDNSTPIEVEDTMRLEDAPSSKEPEIEAAEGLNPRKSQLDAIYENRRKQMEKESNFGAEVIKESVAADLQNPEPETALSPAENSEEAAPALAEADDKTAAPLVQEHTPEEKLFTLVVDGVPLKLTESQLIERAQKGIGAEKRFEEARRLNDEAKSFLYGTQPSQPQAPVQQHSAPQGYPAKPIDLDDSTAEDFLNKLNFGSKDEQKAALKTLVSKVATQSPTQAIPDIGQIVNAATQNAVAAMQSQQTMASLGNQYPDVFSDNILSTAAGILTNQLREKYEQAGVQKTFWEVSNEALSTVRSKYVKSTDTVAQQPTINTVPVTPQVAPMDAKIVAKRAAPKPIVAVNAKAQVESSKPAYKTGVGKSDTVNFLRKSRGQELYN